jgi:ketosteroid isomerase-like protein
VSGAPVPEQERNLAQVARLLEIGEQERNPGLTLHYDEFFAADYEWRPAVSGFGAEVYRGKEGLIQWLADLEAVSTVSVGGFGENRPVGERCVLALGRAWSVGKESGLGLDGEYGVLAEMKGGRASRGRAFLSHTEAEEAAADAQA